jgi:glutathione S-transferase
MFRLLYTPMSPFARKVRVATIETGFDAQITLVETDVWDPKSQTGRDVPLGQVPVLLGGPEPLPGSTLICDYLDSLNTRAKLVPTEPQARWKVLASHALADGVMTAAVAHTVERKRRPAGLQWPQWLVRQEQKIARALVCLESRELNVDRPADLFTITLGCALAYLDFRLPEFDWRAENPKLRRWLMNFEHRPSMQTTQFFVPAAVA